MASEPLEGRYYVADKLLHSAHDTEIDAAEPTLLGEGAMCPKCGGFVGMKPWLSPRRARLTPHGDHWGDFAWFVDELIVSERALQAVRDAGLRAFEGAEEVEVLWRRLPAGDGPPGRYFHVEVPRGRAAVDEARSRIVRSEPWTCDECREAGVDAYCGFALEPGTWSGEDLFEARGAPGLDIATDAFRRVVEANGLTNIGFEPTETFRRDPQNLCPDRAVDRRG